MVSIKTRKQIYGKEATGLLRDLSNYHCIRHRQIYRLYPNKDMSVLDNLLQFLVRQGRIFYDPQTDIYYDSPELQPDREMLAALWVLAEFMNHAEYHSSDLFPGKVIFFADGEAYRIIYVPKDKEALVQHAAAQSDEEDTKCLVIVEEVSQIANLYIPNAIAYCTVTDTGEVQYYKKKQEETD